MAARSKNPRRLGLSCNKWRQGVCGAIADQSNAVAYCPRARAAYAKPGECCHHPLYEVRPLIVEMKRSGVNLLRYRERLRDPDFVKKLYSSFLKASASRSSASSQTKSIS